MRGDFSAWNKDRAHNFRGTLHQQGRVLLDRDWNAQTEILGEWQETAARDAFGAGVAAVPADAPGSFKVTGAEIVGAEVKVTLKKGRVWADGLLAELFKDAAPPPGGDAVRTATYLGPPIQASPLPDAAPAIGDRDAVILETWLEELSPFQQSDLLIEPALGGVDTTERVQTAFRLRLYNMAEGETCDSIIQDLRDDFDAKGKLTVELDPTTETDGDCPVVESGGFTGFEHRLYRIEIADTKHANQSWFKWSHFNGGLVGTGDFDAAVRKVAIHGNKNAILYSGSNSFYLEALDFDKALGCWKVIYGAKAELGNDGKLTLPDPAASPGDIFKGSIPPAPVEGKRFFRLWNGIERVNSFSGPNPKDLPDNLGILIQFEPEAVGKYTPSDFWTFEVRAGGLGNPLKLIDNLPPQGIFYHRVPLAEVNWTSNNPPAADIEDCRRPFQPLTKLKTCCTYRVGDGASSHGDFTKIQDAIDALPKTGGEVCILPGLYEENLVLESPHNRDIILRGCGRRTVIRAKDFKKDSPLQAVIYVMHGQGITIDSLAVEAHDDGMGIYLEGEEKTASDENKDEYLKDIILSGLFISAKTNNAIMGFPAQFLTFTNSVVYVQDKHTNKPAVYLEGDDMLIERNEIRVLPDRGQIEFDERIKSMGDGLTNDPNLFKPARLAAGGLQIGGGSERVRILNNLIINGRGNGITLGRIDLKRGDEEKPNRNPFKPKDKEEDPCNPPDDHIDEGQEDDDGFVAIAGPPLYDILIRFNRIFNMGRNGIGVATFFGLGDEMDLTTNKSADNLTVMGVIVVSKLVITENRIERCMNIATPAIPDKMAHLMGYGGISLAVVENLVIRDNFIVDNCVDCRAPVCGIYVTATIGLDISRNEISEHLVQDFDNVNAGNVKIGPRGGIWVFIAVGQMDILTGKSRADFQKFDVLRNSSGAHAAKIHENVVSVPLGRSLTLMVLGDASVLGNRFTSFGIQPVDIVKLILSIFRGNKPNMSVFLQVLGFLTANVLIFDLGSFLIIREFQRLSRAGKLPNQDSSNTGANQPAYTTIGYQNPLFTVAGLIIKSGFIQFSNNQCKLNPQGKELSIAISSILIAGLSDVGFHNNQTSCDLPNDLLVTNAALVGGTLRVTGNWFKETMFHVGVSALTLGLLNITTDNESVHCLSINGLSYLDRYNLVLSAAILGGITGPVTEETWKRQEELCKRQRGLDKIGAQMFEAILRGRKDQDAVENIGVTYKARGGV